MPKVLVMKKVADPVLIQGRPAGQGIAALRALGARIAAAGAE